MKKHSIILILILVSLRLFHQDISLAAETPAQIVERAHVAHGGRWRSDVNDWVGHGTITYYSSGGRPTTYSMKLHSRGTRDIQLVLVQPAGESRFGSTRAATWQSFAPRNRGSFSAPAVGKKLHFIHAHTVRSVPTLFNYQTQGLVEVL